MFRCRPRKNHHCSQYFFPFLSLDVCLSGGSRCVCWFFRADLAATAPVHTHTGLQQLSVLHTGELREPACGGSSPVPAGTRTCHRNVNVFQPSSRICSGLFRLVHQLCGVHWPSVHSPLKIGHIKKLPGLTCLTDTQDLLLVKTLRLQAHLSCETWQVRQSAGLLLKNNLKDQITTMAPVYRHYIQVCQTGQDCLLVQQGPPLALF